MNGIKRTLIMLATLALLGAGSAWANTVTDVRMSAESDAVRIILDTEDSPGEPSVFTTDQPTRIVVELSDTDSRVPAGRNPVNAGPVQSYMTVAAGDRTRLVVDLSRTAPYEVDVDGNSVVLAIETGGAPTARGTAVGDARGGESFEITGLDFRRGSGGESRVLVDLDGSGVNVSVDERGDQLRVNLFDTRLPDDLRERLDVADFATPVQMITPEPRGDNVRLRLDVSGSYEHLAYQSDGQLIIEVARPEVEEPRSRELEFFQERDYTGDSITLNFQDIPVRSVLQLIADISDLNIVVSDSVEGSLTLRLTNVPWDQALDIVLETKNLDMRESGNVRWVAPASEIAAREQQILRARAERQTLEPLRTAMIPVSYADSESLSELIRTTSAARTDEGLLSERGSVSVDKRTNTLLVTDTSERIESIRELVEELDRPVRQVLIESRIVIARHDFNHELGVRFGVTGADESSSRLLATSGGSSALDRMGSQALINRQTGGRRVIIPGEGEGGADLEFRDGPIMIPPLDERLNVNLPVSDPAGQFGLSFLASDFLLDLELSALEAEGEGEVISTPRVITANQNEAFIQQGVEIPYATEGGTLSGSDIEFKEAVLELRVTPLITPDNRVQLNLQVKQDTVGEIFPTVGGEVPSIDTRELGTRVLVENGQTVVLGGIFQEERNYNTTKVPLLGDIPVLGNLFRRRATDDQKRELLIFVTPSILDEQVLLD